MTDPWESFVGEAESSEVAGYFERASDVRGSVGRSTWFTHAEDTRTVDPRTDFAEIARASDRFLEGGRHRVVLGYLGFEAVGLFEPALRKFPADCPFPLGEFAFATGVRTAAVRARRRVRAIPARPLSCPRETLPRERFSTSVRRLRQAIRDGEAYQVVLANRRSWKRPVDLLERAGRLRATERYAFFFYLRFGDRELVGASPESVVEISGSSAVINPIAGTLPSDGSARGRVPLTADPKELCEHRMLVDLARNDLGRVAVPGSVRLLRSEARVRYARLEHLVSRVGARLPRSVGSWDVLSVAFPAGTVSGAPKIRATELLRGEERTWRGPYAGAVGLIRPSRRADWALTIRSAFAAGPRLYTEAGAGIVYRSDPAREFHETLAKLAHVEDALVGRLP